MTKTTVLGLRISNSRLCLGVVFKCPFRCRLSRDREIGGSSGHQLVSQALTVTITVWPSSSLWTIRDKTACIGVEWAMRVAMPPLAIEVREEVWEQELTLDRQVSPLHFSIQAHSANTKSSYPHRCRTIRETNSSLNYPWKTQRDSTWALRLAPQLEVAPSHCNTERCFMSNRNL